MHQCAIWKRQQRFGSALSFRARLAVEAVLIHCIVHRLREITFQLNSSDRNTVEEKNQINRILIMQRITQLADDAQPIFGVPEKNSGFIAKAGLNWARASGWRRPSISTP